MNKAFTFDDVLLVPQYNEISSRSKVSISNTCKQNKFQLTLPIFSANMDSITGSMMCEYMRSRGGMGVLHRFMSIEKNIEEYKKFPDCFVSVGASDSEYERFLALRNAGATRVVVDIAHGHSRIVGDMIRRIKDTDSNVLVMAGNVCTYDGAKYLEDNGADLVKVGVGGGSVCSTRIKTGHGYPQLSAIQECSKIGVSIVADGGLKNPGDCIKALAFGADFLMIGSILSGTFCTPGVSVYDGDKYVKTFRGMASKEANQDFFGGLSEWKTAEGVSIAVPYKDKEQTDEIIQDIIGGLRSGLTYSGVDSIKSLQVNKKYVMVTSNTLVENKPHKMG